MSHNQPILKYCIDGFTWLPLIQGGIIKKKQKMINKTIVINI
jgi:hypothetical protein